MISHERNAYTPHAHAWVRKRMRRIPSIIAFNDPLRLFFLVSSSDFTTATAAFTSTPSGACPCACACAESSTSSGTFGDATSASWSAANVSGVSGPELSSPLLLPPDAEAVSGVAGPGRGAVRDQMSSSASLKCDAVDVSALTSVAVAAAASASVENERKRVESAEGSTRSSGRSWPALSGSAALDEDDEDDGAGTDAAFTATDTDTGTGEEDEEEGKNVSRASTAARSSGRVMRAAGSSSKMRPRMCAAPAEMGRFAWSQGAPARRKRRKPSSVLGEATYHGFRPLTMLHRIVPRAHTSEGPVWYGVFSW